MSKKILLIGGGGHCRSVLDTLLELDSYTDIAIADDNIEPGTTIMGVPVIGSCNDLPGLIAAGYGEAFVAIGSIGNPQVRIRIFDLLEKIGFCIPNIFDKTSVASRYAVLGKGIFAGKNSVINAGAAVGDCVIINTSVVVEHECRVGCFSHISSGSVLCGNVKVGDRTHIGANSVIRQGLTIGADSMIGMGSVVSESIPGSVTAFGRPCKVVWQNNLNREVNTDSIKQ
jgi:sugar O-acyltransferase (sialic acid O-acetyltransferase NeuD family)